MLTVLESVLVAILIAVDLVASKWLGKQAYSWMPGQGTAEAKHVDDLFSFLVTVGAFIFLGIAAVIGYSILFYRAPKGDFTHGHPARGDWRIEVLWTVVPIGLVLWVAIQSNTIYHQLNIQGLTPIVRHMLMEEPAYAEGTDNDAKPTAPGNAQPTTEEIEVMSKQWSWSFRYPGDVTSTELHLPVNQSVLLKLESADVIHGFYVPEFRVKQDIIPNRTITFAVTPTQQGKYRLRDSSFSGPYLPLMEADVYVEPADTYKRWLALAATQKPTSAKNPAFLEHTQQPQKALGNGWPVVVPAQPPVVHHPS